MVEVGRDAVVPYGGNAGARGKRERKSVIGLPLCQSSETGSMSIKRWLSFCHLSRKVMFARKSIRALWPCAGKGRWK